MAETFQELETLGYLSQQLNRQAFSLPPLEGWLNSFLVQVCQRLASYGLQGIQITHIIGSMAVEMGRAGKVPYGTPDRYSLTEASHLKNVVDNKAFITHGTNLLYPMTVGQDMVGVLIAYQQAVSANSIVLQSFLAALAPQIGPALLQHLKSPGPQTDRLTRQIEMLRSLYQTTRNVSSALQSHEVLQRAAQSLVETLRIDHVGIVLIDAQKMKGRLAAEYPDNNWLGLNIDIVPDLYNLAKNNHSQPLIFNNVDEIIDPLLAKPKAVWQEYGIKSVALIPMMVGDELIGTVGLDIYYDYHNFTPEEIEGALTITTQLGVSVHNARLFESMQEQADQLQHLTEFGRRLNSTLNNEQIFYTIEHQLGFLVDFKLAALGLLNETSTILQLALLYPNAELQWSHLQAAETGLHFVMSNQQTVIVDDITNTNFPDYQLFIEANMRSAIIVPLIVSEVPIGALIILHDEKGHYVNQDLTFLGQLGNQLAIALENARLYSATLQRANTEQLLNALSLTMREHSGLHNLLAMSLQQMAAALGATRARIRLQPQFPQTNTDRLAQTMKASLTDKDKAK